MRKILIASLLSALVFVSTTASANFIFGNASKYNMRITCGDNSFEMPTLKATAKPIKPAKTHQTILPYNTKQQEYPITFSYFNPANGQLVFADKLLGKVTCTSTETNSCVGSISFKEKSFADFIEVYGPNKAGDINVVFDDLPASKIKS